MSDLPEKRSIMKDFKAEAFSIPNLLSWFRLLLIPVFIVQYMNGEFLNALLTLAVSGLSDVLDGRIARKYNMVTDVGKVLDPIADKLTQAALLVCIAAYHRKVIVLLALLVVKETLLLVFGGMTLKKCDSIHSAMWHGKLCTVVFESTMIVLMLFPDIPEGAVSIMTVICGAVMLFSLIMYLAYYIGMLRKRARG